MDTPERIRRLYERLPMGSAFRKAIEQAVEITENLTGISIGPKEKAEPQQDETEGGPPREALSDV